MIKNLISIKLTFGLILIINFMTYAQDSLILEEVQTYYLDGTLKTIEENKFNEYGEITQFSRYETEDNTTYFHNTYYDSINRPIKEESIISNQVIDSVIYLYSKNGLKSEIRFVQDYLADWKSEKWVIQYNKRDQPISESWYEITVFMDGDSLISLISETKKYYDEHHKLIVDSTFKGKGGGSSMPMVIDGKFVEREKINAATVTNYEYDGSFLVTSEKIDEYGYKQIENHFRNEMGDYIRYEQISISLKDTNSIVTNFSYEFKKGRKIQISETQTPFSFSKSRTYFDKNGNKLKHESLDNDGTVISMTEYIYNNLGYLKEEKYLYLIDQQPINNLNNEPMGYRKIYLYRNTTNTN